MGVDIILRSAVPKRNWFASFGKTTSVLDEITQCAASFAEERGLETFLVIRERDESNLALALHPAEQAAQFSLGNDEIAVAARTSNCGPGYHVYVVDLLRQLERRCGLNWVEDKEAGEVDDTDYFNSGDFQDVIAQMNGWLRLNLSHVSEMSKDEAYGTFTVGIPTTFAGADFETGTVLTVRGPIDIGTITSSTDLGNDEFRSFADDWYVWPSPETDLTFWERTSHSLLWCDVPWRPPLTDNDEWAYDAARHALDQFKMAGGDAELFKLEEAEIAQMTASRDGQQFPMPFPDGRGYKRRRLTRPLQDHWTIKIPGHWYLEQTDDDAAYWYANMTLRSNLQMIQSNTGRPATELLTEIVDEVASEGSSAPEIQRIVEDTFVGFIQEAEDAGDANFALLGRYANDNTILFVSCYFDDAAERATALDYLQSVRYAGPPSETKFVDEHGEVERKLN